MEPSWTGVSDNEEGCGKGAGRDRMYPTATLLGLHRVHTPASISVILALTSSKSISSHFSGGGQEYWVIPKFCFLSQILVEDLSVFFSCGAKRRKQGRPGISLAVQGLKIHASPAGSTDSIPGQGNKIPHVSRWPKEEKEKQQGSLRGGQKEHKGLRILEPCTFLAAVSLRSVLYRFPHTCFLKLLII